MFGCDKHTEPLKGHSDDFFLNEQFFAFPRQYLHTYILTYVLHHNMFAILRNTAVFSRVITRECRHIERGH